MNLPSAVLLRPPDNASTTANPFLLLSHLLAHDLPRKSSAAPALLQLQLQQHTPDPLVTYDQVEFGASHESLTSLPHEPRAASNERRSVRIRALLRMFECSNVFISLLHCIMSVSDPLIPSIFSSASIPYYLGPVSSFIPLDPYDVRG